MVGIEDRTRNGTNDINDKNRELFVRSGLFRSLGKHFPNDLATPRAIIDRDWPAVAQHLVFQQRNRAIFFRSLPRLSRSFLFSV